MNTEPLCEICSARPAKMTIVRRRLDDEHRTLVCPECAAERARLYAGARLDVGAVLARLDGSARRERLPGNCCEVCGSTLADIVTDGRPGCCACYSLFRTEIEAAIREAQGALRHVGKAFDR